MLHLFFAWLLMPQLLRIVICLVNYLQSSDLSDVAETRVCVSIMCDLLQFVHTECLLPQCVTVCGMVVMFTTYGMWNGCHVYQIGYVDGYKLIIIYLYFKRDTVKSFYVSFYLNFIISNFSD